MIEVFLAFFGGIVILFKHILSESEIYDKNKYKEERNRDLNRARELYMTSTDIEKKVRQFVDDNYDWLVTKEFNDDIIFIYGDGLCGLRDSIYDLKECITHLVLAKHYKRLLCWMRSYRAGVGDQMRISLRLFSVINKYLDAEECKLTMVPSINKGGVYSWGPYGAEFLPAVRNNYSHMTESMEISWQKYCK